MTGEDIIRLAMDVEGTKVQALSGSTIEVQFKGERKATKRNPTPTPEHYRVTFLTRQKPLPMPGGDSLAGIVVWIPSKALKDVLSPSASEAPSPVSSPSPAEGKQES
jgi:hypothetical protein